MMKLLAIYSTGSSVYVHIVCVCGLFFIIRVYRIYYYVFFMSSVFMNNIGEVGTDQLNVSASFVTMLHFRAYFPSCSIQWPPAIVVKTEAIHLLSSKRFSRGVAPGAEVFLVQ